jgi:hypothetical protein
MNESISGTLTPLPVMAELVPTILAIVRPALQGVDGRHKAATTGTGGMCRNRDSK